jgi:hypothetical protein
MSDACGANQKDRTAPAVMRLTIPLSEANGGEEIS